MNEHIANASAYNLQCIRNYIIVQINEVSRLSTDCWWNLWPTGFRQLNVGCVFAFGV